MWLRTLLARPLRRSLLLKPKVETAAEVIGPSARWPKQILLAHGSEKRKAERFEKSGTRSDGSRWIRISFLTSLPGCLHGRGLEPLFGPLSGLGRSFELILQLLFPKLGQQRAHCRAGLHPQGNQIGAFEQRGANPGLLFQLPGLFHEEL